MADVDDVACHRSERPGQTYSGSVTTTTIMVSSAQGHTTSRLAETSRNSVSTGDVDFSNRRATLSDLSPIRYSPTRQVDSTSGYVESSETRAGLDGAAARRDSPVAELRPHKIADSANIQALMPTTRHPATAAQPACVPERAHKSPEPHRASEATKTARLEHTDSLDFLSRSDQHATGADHASQSACVRERTHKSLETPESASLQVGIEPSTHRNDEARSRPQTSEPRRELHHAPSQRS